MTAAHRQQVTEATAALCRWAVDAVRAPIPPHVLQRAASVLRDDLAAMVGGAQVDDVARFQSAWIAQEQPREATVYGRHAWRAGSLQAAVANAVAMNWLELDEGYRPVPCHAGLYVIPALLATAEGRLTTSQVLSVLAVGYEIVTRVARAFRVDEVLMQSHGRYGAVGACAARALALGVDGATLESALNAAATLIGPAPRNHLALGGMIRNAWPAAGAFNGMMAVQWAGAGMGGLPGGLYDVYATVLGGKANPEALDLDLGRRWAILDGYAKIYACCQHLHSSVEAALDVRTQAGWSQEMVDQVAAIDVVTHPLALPLVNPAPTTTLGAKFSMNHAVAASLVHGSGGADAFDSDSLCNPAIAALRPKVRLTAYTPLPEPPNDRPGKVTVRLADGRQWRSECLSAAGGPDRPLSAEVLRDKAVSLTAPVYPQMVDVLESLLALDTAALARPWTETVAYLTARPPH